MYINTFSQECKLRDCGGLTEKNPHRLACLNIFSLDGTVWRIRRCGLLEEVCHWRWALRFQKTPTTLWSELSLPLAWAWDVSSQLFLPPCLHSTPWTKFNLLNQKSSSTRFYKLLWSCCFTPTIGKYAMWRNCGLLTAFSLMFKDSA